MPGDTKVVQKGKGDKIFINTTGIGRIPDHVRVSADAVRPGDMIILSGSMAPAIPVGSELHIAAAGLAMLPIIVKEGVDAVRG